MPSSRREFVRGTLSAGILAGVAPYAFARTRTKLRVLGTHVTLQEPLRLQAEQDLGIDLEFQPGGSAGVLHQASTRPDSFDLYEQWSNSMRVLWEVGAIQGIDTRRLNNWGEINPLAKTGRLQPEVRIGAGDAPNKLLFVQDDGRIGPVPTERISFLPYVHNVDSFGYNAATIPEGQAYETESWAWLLDPAWRGRVALVNEPTIGLFDAALAVQSAGLMQFADIGDLSKQELDQLFQILLEYRKAGHFRGVWSSVPQSVELMARGDVVIESMFSPAVFALKSRNIDCVYASPKEGYRAWHGVMCLSSETKGAAEDAAYDYMNWWLSGWPGAFIARQGYYISNPERSREHQSDAEWAYWYEGLPATEDLLGTDGKVVIQQGEIRDGGSYLQRFNNIAVWNTVMSNYEYTLPYWNEFLSTI